MIHYIIQEGGGGMGCGVGRGVFKISHIPKQYFFSSVYLCLAVALLSSLGFLLILVSDPPSHLSRAEGDFVSGQAEIVEESLQLT